MRTPVSVLVAGCALLSAPPCNAQSLKPFASVEIRGEISDDVAGFIALHSVPSTSPRTFGRLEDLVRETCGFVSPNNLKVFERSVVDQGGTLDGVGGFAVSGQYTLVPTCLPDERQVRLVGRLPSSDETLSQIFDRDVPGGFYTTLGRDTADARRTVSPEIASGLGIDRAIALEQAGFDMPAVASAAPETPAADSAAITRYLRQAILDPDDRSRVAYEAFAVSMELRGSGVDAAAVGSAVETALRNIGAGDVDLVLEDVDAAIRSGQQVPRLNEIPALQDRCVSSTNLCEAEASGAIVHLDRIPSDVATALNPRNRVRDIDTIYNNVPIVSAAPVAQEAVIPLVADAPAPTGVAVTAELANDPSEVALFENVPDPANGTGGPKCTDGDYANWGTDAFRDQFRQVVEAALAKKVEAEGAPTTTEALVLDGGFFRFESESFGGADWNTVPSFGRHSTGDSLVGMAEDQIKKIVHGTAVTSVVLGGPGLMDLTPSLDLPITVEAQSIYRIETQNGQSTYYLVDNVANAVAHSGAQIVNLSFGTTDDNDARIRDIRDTLLGRDGKLLVVAAGNLGNNNRTIDGTSVRSVGLAPQEWGGEDDAKWNMIVVAGMDPDVDPARLAWFSNFGDDDVFLGAPACHVPILMPTEQATYVESTFNGTSFATPIVSFVAALVRTVSPRERGNAPWVRSRLLSTADIEADVANDKIAWGRVLNPVAAVQVYDDIITLRAPLEDGRQMLTGEIVSIAGFTTLTKGAFCTQQFNRPHDLLRLFRDPRTPEGAPLVWRIDLMGPQDIMETEPCTPRGSDPLVIVTDHGEETLRIDSIDDIKFGFHRGPQ